MKKNNPNHHAYGTHLMGLETISQYLNYNNWIYSMFSNYIKGNVMDIGAGFGNLASLYVSKSDSLTLVEPEEKYYLHLKKQYEDLQKVDVVKCNIEGLAEKSNKKYDAIIMTNVLEHIEGDVEAISRLKPIISEDDGKLLIFVPAFNMLYSKFDKDIKHYRRYTKKSLASTLNHAGYHIDEIKYFNIVGFFGWLILVKFLNKTPANSSLPNIFDKYFVSKLQKMESIINVPFGQSLYAVATPKKINL